MEKITPSEAYDCSSARAPTRAVHQLPAPVTIQQVLKHFSKKRIQQINSAAGADETTKPPSKASSNSSIFPTDVTLTAHDVQEFCDGLTEIFEAALPKFLLYPQEQPQYEELVKSMDEEDETKKKRLTEIYGCEYLLRLYVRLPVLMQSESVSNIKLVGPLLAELLVLLQKNKQACFKGSYRQPRAEELLDLEKRTFNQQSMDI